MKKTFPNRKIDRFGPEEDFLNVSRTLDCEDDARDLSIILTDKILNKFESTTPDGFKGVVIPFDDEENNPKSNYSFELQDLITEIILKEYKIKKD